MIRTCEPGRRGPTGGGRERRPSAADEVPPTWPDRDAAVPAHVGCVMDGNGRWAAQRGLPRTEGHIAGEEALFNVVDGALEIGVKWLTVYAFSTENWRRPPDEVRFLMNFNETLLSRRRDELHRQGVRIRFAGRRDRRVPRRVLRRDGRVDRAHRREPDHDAHPRLQLRGAGRDRRRGARARGRRASLRTRSTSGPSARTCTSRTCPTPTWSSAPRASTGSRTSCCGSSPTASCVLRRALARLPPRRISTERSSSTSSAPAATAGSRSVIVTRIAVVRRPPRPRAALCVLAVIGLHRGRSPLLVTAVVLLVLRRGRQPDQRPILALWRSGAAPPTGWPAVSLFRDRGVVLRTYRIGEADRIVVFLTEHHGKVRAVAKGVRRTQVGSAPGSSRSATSRC